MKRWLLTGIAALSVAWGSASAQTGGDVFYWHAEDGDDLVEGPMAFAESLDGPSWGMAEAPAEGTFDVPMHEGFDFVTEAGPAGGGVGMGGPPPFGMMEEGGPGMMRHRVMRFRGRPMGMMGRGMGGPMMHARLAKAIGLTDEQITRMRGMRTVHQKEMIRLGADARIARMELGEVLRQASPRPEDVKAKLASVNALRGQLLEKRVNFRIEMKKVLTPEQQQKMREMWMGGGGGGRGWGGGWGQKDTPQEGPKK